MSALEHEHNVPLTEPAPPRKRIIRIVATLLAIAIVLALLQLVGVDLLGLEIARIVHATDPGLIVLGGGLGLNDRYRDLVTQAIHAAIDTTYALVPPVVAATLGTDAGIIGAALAASSTTREQSPPTLHPQVLPRP